MEAKEREGAERDKRRGTERPSRGWAQQYLERDGDMPPLKPRLFRQPE